MGDAGENEEMGKCISIATYNKMIQLVILDASTLENDQQNKLLKTFAYANAYHKNVVNDIDKWFFYYKLNIFAINYMDKFSEIAYGFLCIYVRMLFSENHSIKIKKFNICK